MQEIFEVHGYYYVVLGFGFKKQLYIQSLL